MKKMEAIHLNNARNGEHYQFHADVLALLDEATAAAAGFSALRREYAGRFAREEVLYGRNRGYECTPEIVRKDEERDRLFLYLKQTVDTRLPLPTRRSGRRQGGWLSCWSLIATATAGLPARTRRWSRR